MNFGFSPWNHPVCEEHLDQSSREDDSEEDDPKVEDLSIGGEGTETFGRKEIFGGSRESDFPQVRGGKKKGNGRNRREREGGND